MEAQEARKILKKHCAAYGDTKYEPAMWVIEALQDAVAIEREACVRVCTTLFDLRDDERARMHAAKCADAIRERSNSEVRPTPVRAVGP